MATRPVVRYRSEPGISANELARYLIAGDHAREGIIRRAKEIATATVIRYRDLRGGLSAFLADPMRPRTLLVDLEATLQQKVDDRSLSDFVREDAQKSVEALQAFHRFLNQLGGYNFQAPPKWGGALDIEGVAVNVYPDLALVAQSRSAQRYGVALFRLAKGDDNESEAAATKRAEMAKYVATLAFMHAQSQCIPDHEPHHSLCLSIDVQNQEVVSASRSISQRANNIRAACRAIKRTWSEV